MDLGIKGRLAVVTGAAGGIGQATARILLDEGTHVLLTGFNEAKLKRATEQLGGESDHLQWVSADLANQVGVDTLRDATNGRADILVHTAGVTGAKGDPLADITDKDWSDAWNIDFMSGVRVARALMPAMVQRGWGRMVFVTSENATQPYPDEAVYNVAKAALLSFVKATGQVYAPKGVLVNAVAPAFIATGMTDRMMKERAEQLGVSTDEAIQSFLDEERPYLVLKRRGRPEEVASVIALLCSEQASFVVGSNWRVDGGSVMAINT
ncbi:MAG: SDR family oxidoreductase [Rhodanobacter sp.]